MAALQAVPTGIIFPDDATAQCDPPAFGLSEQASGRVAIDDLDARLLAALGAGDLVSASLDHLDTVAQIAEASTSS